jgi:ATP-binding cassette subfamily B protein
MKPFPFFKQPDKMDCGPTSLKMIAKFYGKNFSLQKLRELCGISKEGVSLLGISKAAESIGFRTSASKLTYDQLTEIDLPCIIHWRKNHFVVLYAINTPGYWNSSKEDKIKIADPNKGLITYTKNEFLENWLSFEEDGYKGGIILMISPTPSFFLQDGDKSNTLTFSYLSGYLTRYKQLIFQLLIGLGVGSLLQLIVPFLTQSLVDVGINTKNLNFVYIILIAQTMLFLGRTSVDFIRSWLLLHISTRINISILTDFLIKLMKLPMSFFDSKMTGDLMQRMNDQKRIESFLTGSTLTVIFSMFNLIIFGIVLAFYNLSVFFIFLGSSLLYVLWIIIFLKKRRILDFKRFDIGSKNQSNIVQIIGGMQEIKLNNYEQSKRWEWEQIQASLFRFNVKSLALGQYQQAGAFFINEGKNIFITFIMASAVINGELTLGGMMAIQYIIGQLNSPIDQLIGFTQQLQDAKISLERLNEIHEMEDEEPSGKEFLNDLPADKTITLDRITFSYPGVGNEPVLKDISLKILEGKTTAIVGMSGSGKTTIIKLLLRYYGNYKGELKVGSSFLEQLSFGFWRGQCGVVMQDGFIFSDTILKNIIIADQTADKEKLEKALQIANIHDFIQSLPLGLKTKIGDEGNGISQGQKQRILIARAVYKNPEYIFFDEATNALDANNESIIMHNLQEFFVGRTVLVVAHRLSTVKHADNIIVLEKGAVIEQGTHFSLIEQKGKYFELVRNQLELGG